MNKFTGWSQRQADADLCDNSRGKGQRAMKAILIVALAGYLIGTGIAQADHNQSRQGIASGSWMDRFDAWAASLTLGYGPGGFGFKTDKSRTRNSSNRGNDPRQDGNGSFDSSVGRTDPS